MSRSANGVRAFMPPLEPLPGADVAGRGGGPVSRSQLIDMFPALDVVGDGFTKIAVPAGLSIASGHSAWYSLFSMNIDKTYAGEVNIFGYEIEAAPADVDASGGSGAVAWGTDRGLGAAIVIGSFPFLTPGTWASQQCPVAGVEDASGLGMSGGRGRYLGRHGFPAGKLTAASIVKQRTVRSFAPYARRLPRVARVDVALVVRGSYVASLGSAGSLYGFADVQLFVGLTSPDSGYRA